MVVLAACSHQEATTPKQRTTILYSPNGEPLAGGILGNPACHVAMSGWFGRLAGAEGKIPREAFLADARAQFARMDIDHNGYLVSEELERYRRPYRPVIAAAKPPEEEKKHRPSNGKHDSDKSKDDEPIEDGGDPVMSADTNLDFKVTPEEFTIHAQKIFSELNTHNDGALSSDEVLTRCKTEKTDSLVGNALSW